MSERPSSLTVAEVARELRCSENTVRACIRRGQIPGRQIGRIFRIHTETFEAWRRGDTLNGHATGTHPTDIRR